MIRTMGWKPITVTSALLLAGSAVLISGGLVASANTGDQGRALGHPGWADTWMVPVTHGDATGSTNAGLNNQSVRLIIHTTVSGSAVRIRFSNQHGDHSISIGHATVAKPDTSTPAKSDIDSATLHELTFNGQPSAVVQMGDTLLSDPVNMPVGSQQDLVISAYFPTPTGPTTFHSTSRQTNFVGPTDLVDDVAGTGYTITRTCCWFFLTGVDVYRSHNAGPVVVLGDSLGDGNGSTLDANTRWPNLLFGRLADRYGENAPPVLNASLGGSRLNHEGNEPGAGGFPGFNELGRNATARLSDDVFSAIDPQTVITDLGINDIWMNDDSAAAIIGTLRQLNSQIQQHGLTSLVATLGPYQGLAGDGVWTPEKEATRQAVNDWIRHNTEFDGVIDFDRVIADPANPAQLLPAYDSGDHIHPNDLGNQAMADAVPLTLLDR